MPSHLERRGNLWYAFLVIPEDVRKALGKSKFRTALGTPDKRKAATLAAPIVAGWGAIIRRERGEGDAVVREALRWREALSKETGPSFDALEGEVIDRAEQMAEAHGGDLHAPEYRNLPAGQRFADIALGRATPSNAHFDAWKAQLKLTPKTRDQMVKDVSALLAQFPMLQDITHQAVKGWIDELTRKLPPSAPARIVSFCRNYWRYLIRVDAVPSDSDPFAKLGSGGKKKRRETGGGSWGPFKPHDVVKLWKAANTGKDTQLADLILLGAYSGARIEELCSLKLSAVTSNAFKITDAKTAAGIREVPIHSRIKAAVTRLKKASKGGYLLSGLTENKYGDRSNAVGKRFGRLKASLGFDVQHVFHSIRKTFVTLLENAGVSENLAADIVGHEKPRITYGLYSGGATLAEKAPAVELVRYPAGMP
jgi:integrase